MSPAHFADAEELLRRWIGLDPHSIGESAIRRAVRLRMLSLELGDLHAYLRRLEEEPAERDRLVEEVVVAESWFFRDPQVYEQLRRFAVAKLSAGGQGSQIRILSVPCAAGEEPYSVAMTLLDLGYAPERFRIDAIDISRVALAKAVAGRYSPSAFRNADSAYRDRWFRTDKGVTSIDDTVKRCVNFSWANILDERLLEEALGVWRSVYDVVFCRNLLIYLTPDARQAVERNIDLLLKPDGMVVVGAAEPAILRNGWGPFAGGATFTLRRIGAGNVPQWTPPPPRRPPAEPAASPRPAGEARPNPPLPLPAESAEAPPRPAIPPAPPRTTPAAIPTPAPVDDDGVPPATTLPEVIAEANGLANARRFNDAIALCDAAQRRFPPSAELFFITGILHRSIGQDELAEDCFHKTLYLDAAHEDALLALSLLAAGRGDHGRAEQYRDAALRMLERKGAS